MNIQYRKFMNIFALTLILSFIFILPLCAFAQSNTVSAEEIIEKLDKGLDVHYKNKTIVGDLDFTTITEYKVTKRSEWVYLKLIKGSISFENCIFKDRVLGFVDHCCTLITNHSKFLKNIEFINCEFNDVVDFTHTTFESDAVFDKCTFYMRANFTYTEFIGKAVFTGSVFKDVAWFKETEFLSFADFSSTVFKDKGSINFKGATFSKGNSFQGAVFSNGNSFEGALLNKELYLIRSLLIPIL